MKADPVFLPPNTHPTPPTTTHPPRPHTPNTTQTNCQLINISSNRGIPPEMWNQPCSNLSASPEKAIESNTSTGEIWHKIWPTQSISTSFYYILTPIWGLVFKRQLDSCCISIKLFQVVKRSLLRKKYVDDHITWSWGKSWQNTVYQHIEEIQHLNKDFRVMDVGFSHHMNHNFNQFCSICTN